MLSLFISNCYFEVCSYRFSLVAQKCYVRLHKSAADSDPLNRSWDIVSLIRYILDTAPKDGAVSATQNHYAEILPRYRAIVHMIAHRVHYGNPAVCYILLGTNRGGSRILWGRSQTGGGLGSTRRRLQSWERRYEFSPEISLAFSLLHNGGFSCTLLCDHCAMRVAHGIPVGPDALSLLKYSESQTMAFVNFYSLFWGEGSGGWGRTQQILWTPTCLS